MLEHLLFFVNQLKPFFPVDGCQRLHTLKSDFVFSDSVNCCHLHFFDVKLAIVFGIEIVVYQLWLNIDVKTGK